jgi:hypothetical protein
MSTELEQLMEEEMEMTSCVGEGIIQDRREAVRRRSCRESRPCLQGVAQQCLACPRVWAHQHGAAWQGILSNPCVPSTPAAAGAVSVASFRRPF